MTKQPFTCRQHMAKGGPANDAGEIRYTALCGFDGPPVFDAEVLTWLPNEVDCKVCRKQMKATGGAGENTHG